MLSQRPSSATKINSENPDKANIVKGSVTGTQSSVTKSINVVVVKPVNLEKTNLASSIPKVAGNKTKQYSNVKSKISSFHKVPTQQETKMGVKECDTNCLVTNKRIVNEAHSGKDELCEKIECNTDENANQMVLNNVVNGLVCQGNQRDSITKLAEGVCDFSSGSPSDLSGSVMGSGTGEKQPTGKTVSR